MISSKNALLYAYAFFLLGKTGFGVRVHDLQRLIGRWFFATTLTGRYATSPEAAFRDKRQLQDIVAAITPVRNDQAHFRPTPARELQRCHLACEDLRRLIEGLAATT